MPTTVPSTEPADLDIRARRTGPADALSVRSLLDTPELALSDVVCGARAGHGHPEVAGHSSIVFVRTGCFGHTANGVRTLLDATQVYWINHGAEHRYDHPHDGGDVCTSVRVAPALLTSMFGDDPVLPAGSVPTTPRLDLNHRLLLAATRRGAATEEIYERAVDLVAATLALVDARRVDAGRPAARRHRALADAVREALAADPAHPLLDLAGLLGVSVHHLSRVFHTEVGHTVARHRMRLRTRLALERLEGGDSDLARVAADVGFADQSHMCRVLRTETGQGPGGLRRALVDEAAARASVPSS